MKTHIRRKHGGTTESSQKVHNKSWESNYSATTTKVNESYVDTSRQFEEYKDKHDVNSSFLDQILPEMRKLKEFKQLSSELNNLNNSSSIIDSNILQEISAAIYRSSTINSNNFTPNQGSSNSYSQQPASFPFSITFPYVSGDNQRPSVSTKSISQRSTSPNTINQQQPPSNPYQPNNFSQHSSMEARGSGSTLGYQGFVCEKCLYAGIHSIQTSSFRGSLKFNHKCRIQGPISSHHASWMLQNREKELIFRLKRIIDETTHESELIKLIAVRIPYHQFGPISYEEYVDMDPVRRPVPRFIEGAAMQGAAVIYKSEVLEFLKVFVGTLGYFRFRVGEFPYYFFIYISNWLKPEEEDFFRFGTLQRIFLIPH